MKLPFKRSKSKKAKAADALGSVAKLWTELRISKRASEGVEAGAKKMSSAKCAVDSKARTTPVKAVGGLALLGGAGALIARKLKGGGTEPLPYMPPPPPPPSPVPAAVDPVPWKAPAIAEEPPAPGAGAGAGEKPASGDGPSGEEPGGDESTDGAPR